MLATKSISIVVVLSFLALLGNAASLPLFYGIDIIFGSIFIMYAAMTLSRYHVVIVAVIGCMYTLYLWGHPYAAIIFFIEAMCVAEAWRRGYRNIVVTDIIYWLFIGVPLVIIFYSNLLDLGLNTAALIALKQTLNGVFNVSIASLIYFVLDVVVQKRQRIGIQPLLFNTILIITLVSGSTPAVLSSHKASSDLEILVKNELDTLAKQVEQSVSSPDQNISLTEISRIITPHDVDVILFDTEQVIFNTGSAEHLRAIQEYEQIERANQVTILLPSVDSSEMNRWRNGLYILNLKVVANDNNVTRITVVKAAESVVKKVGELKIELFVILAFIMLAAIVVSYLLSKLFTYPIKSLQLASETLTESVVGGNNFTLPDEYISEYAILSDNFKRLADQVGDSYNLLQTEKDNLAARVDENVFEINRLSTVASRTTNGVVITDTNGKTEWINDAFIKLSGYELDEVIGKSPGELLQGTDTSKETVSRISRKLRNRQGFSEDIINYSKSGDPYWVHIDCDPILEGNELVGFMAIESDITERKQDEEKLIKRTAELNAVLNAATEISVITTDTKGLITMFNAGAEKMLGYDAEEMIAKETPAKIHLPAEVRERGLELSQKFKKDITGFRVFVELPEIQGSETREWTYIKSDGSKIIVILSVTAIRSSSGEIIGYLGVAQDITERKRLENMKNEFVSTVSHELRTPLTSISGTLKLINGGVVGDIPKKAEELLEIATGNTERLSLLINDLLDMEKIASGKMDFKLRSQPLTPIIEHALNMNESYANQYNVTLCLHDRPQNLLVNVDAHRLLQVMSNFLSNAAKFSNPGDDVEIYIKQEGDFVRVAVSDHGPGISQQFTKHIFSKFSQADSSDSRVKGGTGLGLAISKELVTNMKGDIGFDSKEGEGSTFWFILPVHHESMPVNSQSSSQA